MRATPNFEDFRLKSNVSRETFDKLAIYADLLGRWQKVKNLVAPSTLNQLWDRHFLDSLQLLEFCSGGTLVDLGSGAGFPGLVIAVSFTEAQQGSVTLVESDHRKCAFLREVIRETAARATVVNDRIENVVNDLEFVDIVTARALTALPKLLEYAAPLFKKGAQGLFLKGQDIVSELTDDPIFSMVNLEFFPSKTDSNARIVRVKWRSEGPDPGSGH